MLVLIRRAVLGILLLPAVAIVTADATSSSTRLEESVATAAAATPPLRSRKSHPRLNTDINITFTQKLQQQQQQLLNRPLSPQELEEERQARKRRSLERKARMRQAFADIPAPPKESMEAVSQEEFQTMQQNVKQQQQSNVDNNNQDNEGGDYRRKLSWFGRGSNSGISTVSETYLVDPSQEYDKWAQAYRMLGGYIDCDYKKEGDDHHSGDNNNNNNNQNGDTTTCSRWMIWASYVNPNYQGDAYNEYFGDEPTGVLDCHSPDTEWLLLGVYRQEFYQYIEQISKHLWAIDDYEYVVALAGLAYMTDSDCFGVGYDSSGNYIYAGVAPQPYGKFEMALYTDTYCLEPDTSLGKTYDDFGYQSDVNLGSKDATDDDSKSWAYDWWYDTQEYTLTQLNDVYEEYKYCTSCVDYPTYQDGYYIGDSGTDDDDLINQCWKFWSHNSYTCEAQCIEKANAQGTILSITYGDTVYGRTSSNFYSKDYSSSKSSAEESESPLARLLANAFLTLSFLLFVATFLAFAVARRSRYRESRSSRSRRLLDGGDNADNRSRRSRRSKSQVRPTKDGDGLFKTSGSGAASRSKSGGGTGDRGKSSGGSRRSVRSSSNRSRKPSRRGKSYDPPKGERGGERGGDREHHHGSSRKHQKAPDDEFF